MRLAKPWRWHIICTVIAILLVAGINLIVPAAVRETLAVVADNDSSYEQRMQLIWVLAGVVLGIQLLKAFFQFITRYFSHIAAWRLMSSLRGQIYGHLQGLSQKFYNDKQTGQLISRVMEDTNHLEVFVAHAIPDMITSIVIFVGVLVIMLTINPLLALLVCVPLPLILIISFIFQKIRKYFEIRKKISAELMGMLSDNFQGIKEIQVFNKQDQERARVQKKADHHAETTIRALFWIGVMHPLMGFLHGLGTVAVILFGGMFALNGSLIAADITAFLLYLGLFYAPVADLARIVEDIQEGTTSGRRIFELLDTKSEVVETEGAKNVGLLKGDIEFNKVYFDYTPDVAVLRDLSFKANEGQMIALVGPTGAGKTTIIALLARFYDVTAGSITIDGIDIRDMTLSSLRDNISIVLQDVFLFNGTIADNIAYGRNDDVSMDEIIEAAKAAAVHEFIDNLPEKYETIVGERGTRLSGGQKQRIAIARAVLRKSPILILDEATSAVDNETEREIQNAINAIAGKRTIIAIAHRLSTIERADKILYLENGTVVESGTHKELVKKNGPYSKMKR